ncbi:protein of unknown function DUF2040 [Kalmanozyma brasiliensis GHG001]|uniref:Nuclear speckle splicing regulatory protein 1 N-terminal domain-containing protein n=1 Tax=Kalmanozyma brasiliensis (strain GHG001) TaxID=1365824 RepID=V5E5I9_KALBG|nr:protein of unknown function DUF2040 [Kalmanozyma brasiliensis GHG001]EST05481.1 protein of unknown function DUF2040 [Kalmanozyma brasiliensis GHG001]
MPEPGPSAPKLSFGLKPALAPSSTAPRPSIKASAAAFDVDTDYEGEDHQQAPKASTSRGKSTGRSIDLRALAPAKSAAPATRTEKKKLQEAEQLDASIFDYDGVYDTIKDAERKVKQARTDEDAIKKPKYVDGILESAEQRKRDRLRAEARTIQKQRQAEGDEFADKEAFVTNAYKEQQAELAKAEEQQEDSQQRASSKGMGSFYRDMLNETNAARDAAIAASLANQSSTSSAQDSQQEARERTDADLAREAKEKGLEVELNDDNQIVDKRSLLSKGLNVVSKRSKSGRDDHLSSSGHDSRESRRERDQRRQEEYEARMNRDAQRSRQSAVIEEQMLELERKRALEEEEANRREKSKVDAKRNDSESISAAKQRYLERKRQRLATGQES